MTELEVHIKPIGELGVTQADSFIYQRVKDFLLGRMGGRNSAGYKTIMNSGFDIQNATGSSLPFIIAATELLEETNVATILSLEDIIKIITHGKANGKNHFKGIYVDTNEPILYLNDNSSLSLNLAEIARNQNNTPYDAENPARFTGLRVDKADNKEGYRLIETSKTQIITDPRFSYSNNEQEIDFNGTPIKVFTKKTGSSRLYAYEDGLYAGDGVPADSSGVGRVGLVHAEGVGSKN